MTSAPDTFWCWTFTDTKTDHFFFAVFTNHRNVIAYHPVTKLMDADYRATDGGK